MNTPGLYCWASSTDARRVTNVDGVGIDLADHPDN